MNPLPWRVEWRESARRDLRRLERDFQQRIARAVDRLAARARTHAPNLVDQEQRIARAVDRLAATGHSDVKRLVNLDAEFRLRVGPWRVLFDRDIESHTLVILHVYPRGSAYD